MSGKFYETVNAAAVESKPDVYVLATDIDHLSQKSKTMG